MANPWQLALLKRSVAEWNTWRTTHRDIRSLSGADLYGDITVNLSGADLTGADLTGADLGSVYLIGGAILSEADLSGAILRSVNLSGAYLVGAILRGVDLSNADLSGAKLMIADLSGADLSGADLSGATLFGTDLSNADLTDADLSGAGLNNADLTDADLTRAKGFLPRSKGPKPQLGQPSSTTDWLSLVETFGSTLLVTAATLASIIQGADVIERRWRERKEKHQQQSPLATSLSSSKTPIPDTDITDILLVMDDGSHHTFKRWISEPDTLRAYIDAFSDRTSKVRPLQVVFTKRKGRALAVDVTEGGKDNQQLNMILSYLEADPL